MVLPSDLHPAVQQDALSAGSTLCDGSPAPSPAITLLLDALQLRLSSLHFSAVNLQG